MKHIYIVILISFVLSSCSNSFLDLYPETSLHESNFYQSDEEFVALVNGGYIPMRNLAKTVNWDISEVKSDNMDLQVSNTNIEQSRNNDFLMSSASIVHKSFWDNAYKGVYACNKSITAIEEREYVWTDEALKERSLGEAYFLRAYYYFDLVRQFGGVPLVLKEINSQDAVLIKRAPVEDVYKQIVADLEASISHLEKMGNTGENGRVNLGAAQALLGKVYLTNKDYKNSEVYLNKVIQSGKFGLLPNYADVFNPAKKDYYETIFSVQFSETAADLANTFIFFNAPSTSKGAITGRDNVGLQVNIAIKPTEDLIDAFEDGDERYATAIGEWTGIDDGGEVKGFFYCAKYKGPQTAALGWSGDNFPILRYSDVLLMYAEVLNELNRTAEAIPYVEQVRNRVGLLDKISNLGKSALTKLIEKERRVEFSFENQRWYDLLRTDRALEVMREHGKQIEPYHLLAPIPVDQVLINKLEQNDRY